MEHTITNEMIIDFNVLHTSMQNGMSNKMGGAEIVTKEDWGNEEWNVQFSGKCFNPNKF